MTSTSLAIMVGYQATVISVAEAVIDRLGQTPAYRRQLLKVLEAEAADDKPLPKGVLEQQRLAAACKGPAPKPASPLPLDEAIEEIS